MSTDHPPPAEAATDMEWDRDYAHLDAQDAWEPVVGIEAVKVWAWMLAPIVVGVAALFVIVRWGDVIAEAIASLI